MLMCVCLSLLPLGSRHQRGQTLTHQCRVRVVDAEHPLVIGERPLKERDRLSCPGPHPGRRSQQLFLDFKVFGWSMPSTRSMVGEGALDAAGSPRPSGPRARRRWRGCSGSEGVGVVGAQEPFAVGEGALV